MRVVAGGDPAHDAELADVVDVEDVHTEEGEVGRSRPSSGCLRGGLGEMVANCGLILVGDLGDVADEGGAALLLEGRRRRRASATKRLAQRIGLEVLGVHGHVADEEEGTAGGVVSA